MQIDTQHLHHWMCAIRQSPDPIRTMDAFWSGQLHSKEWLIHTIEKHRTLPATIDIHGGWVGVLASMLFQSSIPINHITSLDIDPSCESIATNMNKLEEMQGKFCAVTSDMCEVHSSADIIINTSCEHITQEQHDRWLINMSKDSLLVLQSNNYDIPEHVRIAKNLEDFKMQSGLEKILYAGELDLPLYTRYMIIGYKSKY